MIGLASGSGKLRGLWRPEVVAALPRAGPPGSGPLVTPFAGVPPGEPIVGTATAASSVGRGWPLCASSPVVVSGRSRCSARWLDPSYPVTGFDSWSGGARVRRRHLRSLYSGCCRSSVPGNLVALMAYHATVPFHHARRPCGKACVCRWLEKEASRLDGMTRWSHTHTLELLIQLLQVLCVVASFRGHTSGDLKDA
ncbi:hypothetical protein GW17_00056633 [Ensete ventricosum]|nr:hypothetical protein GW17_00056633 [Ensete ventricosum]